ncbi:MAG: phosphate regulon sensor histidine kinase PhoR [Halopseudomonas sp.]
MHQPVKFLFKRQLLVLLLAVVVGWLLGSVAWALVLALAGLLLWHSWQLNRLMSWLRKSDHREVPEGRGLWGDLFDDLYRLLNRHRKAEAKLRQVINRVQKSTSALRDAVVMLDSNGDLEWWNRSARRLLGLRRPDDIGQPITNLIRDPRFLRYIELRQFGEPLELPSPIDTRMQLQFTVTEFGQSDCLMLIRDVTRLQQLERMRRDFVGNASHELRTPLTVIRGYLETLQEQQDLPPVMQRALQQMEGQSIRMGNLVTDMLMLSRLETTDSLVDELPIDIGRMLREVREDAASLAPEKQLHIQLDVDERNLLLGQEKELLSAFSNLATNAVKYTPAEGRVDLRWWVDDQGGHFEVCDTGVGIDTLHLGRLTERFYRVDDGRSTAQGGTGLGLAIVKHVMIRHGGVLEVDSLPGKGSCFRCHFPTKLIQPKQADSVAG